MTSPAPPAAAVPVGHAGRRRSLSRELLRGWQATRLLGICAWFHLFKLLGNVIDRDEGVIEQQVARLLSRRILDHLELRVQVTGAEQIAGLGSFHVAANHASYLDWVVLLAHFPTPLRFVAKREATRVPVLGSYLELRGVVIDRQRGEAARAAIRAASVDGQPWPIVLFPEGTRSRDGEVQRFHRGGLGVLFESGRPVVPVALLGTHAALARNDRTITPGRRLGMHLLEPVEPGAFPDAAAAAAEVERRIRAHIEGAGSIIG